MADQHHGNANNGLHDRTSGSSARGSKRQRAADDLVYNERAILTPVVIASLPGIGASYKVKFTVNSGISAPYKHYVENSKNQHCYSLRVLAKNAKPEDYTSTTVNDLMQHSGLFNTYVKTFLNGDCNHDSSFRLQLDGITQKTVALVIDGLYRREVTITPHNIEGLMFLVDYLQMKCYLEPCMDYLLLHLLPKAPNQAVKVMWNGPQRYRDVLMEQLRTMPWDSEALKASLAELPLAEARQLLADRAGNSCTTPTMSTIIQAGTKWGGGAEAEMLLDVIDWQLISPVELEQVQRAAAACCARVCEAKTMLGQQQGGAPNQLLAKLSALQIFYSRVLAKAVLLSWQRRPERRPRNPKNGILVEKLPRLRETDRSGRALVCVKVVPQPEAGVVGKVRNGGKFDLAGHELQVVRPSNSAPYLRVASLRARVQVTALHMGTTNAEQADQASSSYSLGVELRKAGRMWHVPQGDAAAAVLHPLAQQPEDELWATLLVCAPRTPAPPPQEAGSDSDTDIEDWGSEDWGSEDWDDY